MFSNSIFAYKDSCNDNYFDNNLNYVPNVDQKLKIYLEKKCNKYLNIHFPKDLENDEIFQIKDEDILPTNNNSLLDNIIGPCSFNAEDKIVNEIKEDLFQINSDKNNVMVINDDINQELKYLNKKYIKIIFAFSMIFIIKNS